MWRITATDREGREVARLEVESGDLSVGRDADRQLILPAPSVSRRHCRLRIDGNGPVIMDEGSANGVIVNGVRITTPTPVNQMSRIEVAEFRLAVEPLGPQRPPVPAMDPSMAQQMPMMMGAGQPPPQQQMGMPQDVVRLIAEGGPYDGRIFDLPQLPEIAVGRAVDNDVILDDPSLSRKHSKLRRMGQGRLEVEDANSANGTYVNGRKINRAQVGPGDTLRFGELMFRIDGGGLVPQQRPQITPEVAQAPAGVKYALFGLIGVTVLVYGVLVMRMVQTPAAPPKGQMEEAIRKRIAQAEPILAEAKAAFDQKDWAKAKARAEAAQDIDPANTTAAHLRSVASRAEDDQQKFKQGSAEMEKGSPDSLQAALRTFHGISPDSPFRQEFAEKLYGKLQTASQNLCRRKAFRECAYMLCEAYRVAPSSQKTGTDLIRQLRDAERRAKMVGQAQCVMK